MKQTPAEIEREIERTRELMSRDIDAIGARLSPNRLKTKARGSIAEAKEAVVGKVRNATESTGDTIVDALRRNPIPTVLASGAAAWVLMRAQEGDGDRGTPSGRETRVRRVGHRAQHVWDDNPLMVGAIVLVLGAVIGAFLPETEQENRAFGPARDRLTDRARATADDVKDAARETVQSAKDTARDELRDLTGAGRA